MAPTIPPKDAIDFFLASGWRQFFLNQQFEICPPYTSLTDLLKSAQLMGTAFVNLFTPSSREKLDPRLVQLADSAGRQAIPSMVLTLQTNSASGELPVEIMLYPAPEEGALYIGFIRPLPDTLVDFLQERLADQRSLKTRLFEAVAHLGHHIAAILDLNELLDYVVTSLNRDFEYLYPAIFLMDNSLTTVTLKAIAGMSIETIPTDSLTLALDKPTVISRVVSTATPLQIQNLSEMAYQPFNYLPVDVQAELAVPVVSGTQVLGVLDVRSPAANAYREDDLLLLQTIANQLAVAIENARLFEERDRRLAELDVFNQIGVMIVGHQDLNSMLSDILYRVNTLFQVEAVSLMLLEEDGLHFALSKGAGADEVKSFVLKPGQGIAWSVVESRQTIRVDDVTADPRHFNGIDSVIDDFSTKSLLAVPVQIQDRVLGVIEMMNRLDGQPFSRDNEVALEFIASAVAVSIENERLFQETQEQLSALTTLSRASETITKAHNLDQLLNVVLDLTLSIIGADKGAIVLPDNHLANVLRIEAARGFEQKEIERFNRSHFSQYAGTFSLSYGTRQVLEVEDSTTDPRIFTSSEVTWQFPKSFTHLPLFSQDSFIGLIILYALPDDETRGLLRTVADVAAVAIDKARLYKETNQWLAEVLTLYTLAEQLTKVADLTLNDIIQSSVSILAYALDCNHCCLFLRENSGSPASLVLKACSGARPGYEKSLETEYLTRLVKAVIQKPRSVYIEDVTQQGVAAGLFLPELSDFLAESKANQADIQTRSVMIVPLFIKDEVMGALSINDRRINAFGQSEDRLLTIAAAQVSTAIENIRLYNDLEQRAAELEIALDEVQEAHRIKSEFVQNVSHELRTPLTFVRAYVELMLEGSLGEIPEAVKEKLEIISQKTEAITRLVEDVVSLQKIEAGNLKFQLVKPNELIARATQAAIAGAAEYDLEIVSHSSPELLPVKVDVDRIGQVFDNLVANAIKFSPSGSKIIIAARQEGDGVKFSVQDFGIGIPADQLDRVFERFYQVDGSTTRRYGGAGLGLAIVKQIVEAHNGHITVESTVNQTTVFSFLLPAVQDKKYV